MIDPPTWLRIALLGAAAALLVWHLATTQPAREDSDD